VLLTSVTLNDLQPQNGRLLVNFCDFQLQNSELRQSGWTWTKITCEQELLWALMHLMSISSDFLLLFISGKRTPGRFDISIEYEDEILTNVCQNFQV